METLIPFFWNSIFLPQSLVWLLVFGGNHSLLFIVQYCRHHIETRPIQHQSIFFNVGTPVEYILLTTFYGLNFNNQLHIYFIQFLQVLTCFMVTINSLPCRNSYLGPPRSTGTKPMRCQLSYPGLDHRSNISTT